MAKCYLIDSVEQRITEVQAEVDLRFLQRMVGGHISLVHRFVTGDCLYVNEDGEGKFRHVFHLHDNAEPFFWGNGIIVGREMDDGHEDVAVSYFELLTEVLFASVDRPGTVYLARPTI